MRLLSNFAVGSSTRLSGIGTRCFPATRTCKEHSR